jgi:hypothetical protein
MVIAVPPARHFHRLLILAAHATALQDIQGLHWDMTTFIAITLSILKDVLPISTLATRTSRSYLFISSFSRGAQWGGD